MAKHGRGLICLALDPRALRRARPRPDGGQERVALPDGVHRVDRGPRGRDHRHLRARPRAHDPGGDRPAVDAAATSSSPATSSRSRRRPAACSSAPARPRRPSTWRAWPASTPAGVICEIMNDDGTMARVPDLERYCARARPEDGHGRRPDRVPPPPRQAGRARGRGPAAHRSSATSTSVGYRSLVDEQAPRGAWSRARSTARTTCSCACTPSASPATSSTRCAATAASSSSGAGADRGGGPGRAALPRPGGARHRPAEQAAGLQAPGAGPRHGGRQRRARACPPTCATTASARRSWSTSA